MIIGKIKKVITMKIYDEDGKFLGEGANYIYKPILMWYDVAIGLVVAYFIFTQTI